MYFTAQQWGRIGERARANRISRGEVVRRILNEVLGLKDEDERLAAVDETAGLIPDAPDWPEWLRQVRGDGGADERLRRLGL
jgi:hypothetical protein